MKQGKAICRSLDRAVEYARRLGLFNRLNTFGNKCKSQFFKDLGINIHEGFGKGVRVFWDSDSQIYERIGRTLRANWDGVRANWDGVRANWDGFKTWFLVGFSAAARSKSQVGYEKIGKGARGNWDESLHQLT